MSIMEMRENDSALAYCALTQYAHHCDAEWIEGYRHSYVMMLTALATFRTLADALEESEGQVL